MCIQFDDKKPPIEEAIFLVFGDDWGRHPSTLQHIFREIVKTNRVIWINSLGQKVPTFSWKDLKRIAEKIVMFFSPDCKKHQITENLSMHNIIVIPYYKNVLIQKINRHLVKSQLAKILGGMEENILCVTFNPIVVSVLDITRFRCSIYYCLDEYSKLKNVDGPLVLEMEEKILKEADVIIATSKSLVESKGGAGKVWYLPQGVNYIHFSKAAILEGNGRKRKVIGFFGLIDESWFDCELVEELSERYADAEIQLIGRTVGNFDCLRKRENIRFLGEISYDFLPAAARCFDVGIIPFKINDITRFVNPLKLLEYLSCGLPVVSTYMPELEEHGDFVYVSRERKQFLEDVGRALRSDNESVRESRTKYAVGHSWEVRAAEFRRIIVAKSPMKSTQGKESVYA